MSAAQLELFQLTDDDRTDAGAGFDLDRIMNEVARAARIAGKPLSFRQCRDRALDLQAARRQSGAVEIENKA